MLPVAEQLEHRASARRAQQILASRRRDGLNAVQAAPRAAEPAPQDAEIGLPRSQRIGLRRSKSVRTRTVEKAARVVAIPARGLHREAAAQVSRVLERFITATRTQERFEAKRAARHGVAAVCAAEIAAR